LFSVLDVCTFEELLALTYLFRVAALLGIKAYLEIFEAKIMRKKVDYAHFRQTTHASIVLIVITSIAFNCALWKHYGINALIVLGLFGFGIILQLMLLVPAWIQNIAAFLALTFFLQEYS
jgi:hypothetical protein